MSFRDVSLVLRVLTIISAVIVWALRNRPREPETKQYIASIFVMLLFLIASSATGTINPHNDHLTRVLSAIGCAAGLCAVIVFIRKVSRKGRLF
jgi:heme A synthase